ncbi:autotransporter-associated beta strand repeat-containing protein, partial [Achromobacter sp.]|uniref:autotransporter-associated beta strand repeat-containing protein n=1 Tax=Achromobacter sp. TaxID=134375 RepID=UPI002F940A7C
MNHIYRLVWNRAVRVWQPVSELAAQSRGGAAPSAVGAARRWRPHALAAALGLTLAGWGPTAGAWCTGAPTVTCNSPVSPVMPNYSNTSDNLIVNVAAGSGAGVLLGTGGIAMELSGANLQVNNSGIISPTALGPGPTIVSSGLVMGNTAASSVAASTQTLTNNASGIIGGTGGAYSPTLPNFVGMALTVRNGPGGVSALTNYGRITTEGISGSARLAADIPSVVAYGGGQVVFSNTGTINGRVAFEASGTAGQGHVFTNSGVINGSVSLGAGGGNTFIAEAGSSVNAGPGPNGENIAVTGVPGLNFIAPGLVDGGTAGINQLVLANTANLSGTTNISADTYRYFNHLTVTGGTWNMSGGPFVPIGGTVTLTGGLALVDNSGGLGSGPVTAAGGGLGVSTSATVISNNFRLNAGGLTTAGANSFTLAGVLDGAGGLNVTGSGVVTLRGSNSYSGGTTIASGTLAIGAGGSLYSATNLSLAAGSSFDISGAGNQAIGSLAGSGNVLLGANTLTSTGSVSTTFSGRISGTGRLAKSGTGTLTLSGVNAFSGGLEVRGGMLAIAGGGSLAAGTQATVDAGGTLDISSAIGGPVLAELSGNGGEVRLGANTLMLGSGVYDGVISGSGGLVKNATGNLILNGINTYAILGFTDVLAGKLMVGGTSANATASVNGPVVVRSGAAVGGFGRINGDLQVQSGGHLEPGEPGGTLTVDGGLSMEQGSALDFSLGAAGSSHSVQVLGNLTLNGAQLNIRDAGGYGVGMYNLFSYTGILTETNGGILLTAPEQHIQKLLGAKQINLINAGVAELNFWNANGLASPAQLGGGSGTWSRTSANWTDSVGSITSARQPANAFAIFGGAPGTVTVDTIPGAVGTTGVQFISDGYRLKGDALSLVAPSPGALSELRVGNGSLPSASWTATIDNSLIGNGFNKTGQGTLVLGGVNLHAQTRISAGVLSVSSDTSLGAPLAGLDLQGGTLRVTGTSFQQTPRTITLGTLGGGLDIADAANTFTVSQALAGNGNLTKLGAGTLVLTGANTYLGTTTVAAGRLQVGDGATSGSIAGNGSMQAGATLAFNRSDSVVYGGVLSGAGDLRQEGSGTLVLTGKNTMTGTTTVAAGTLQVGDGGATGMLGGNVVNNSRLVFNRATDYTYAGGISGSGALAKQGANILALTGDSSAYAGIAQLSAGTLQVDGKLGGILQAASGTTLSGVGTVGDVTLAPGATLSPGNAATPLGRLNVQGDLTFASGSIYRVAATADGQHSSVNVAGAANLAGSVLHLGQSGTYAPSTAYTIVTAGGGVQGRFDSVSSNLAFLTPTLAYDTQRVDLVVKMKEVPSGEGGTRPIQFADAAASGNQRAVARALQSLPANSDLYRRVLNLPEGAPAAAFDGLSGEAHATSVSTMQGVASTFVQAPMTRLRANLAAGMMPGKPTAQLGLGNAAALPQSAAQPLWAQVFGNWTTLGGDGNAARTTQSDSGLSVGGDM